MSYCLKHYGNNINFLKKIVDDEDDGLFGDYEADDEYQVNSK